MRTVIGENIEMAEELLRRGEIVAVPTETVYGLAANALNIDAVLKIYETKGRPLFNPLIVHVHGADEFSKYATEVPPLVNELAREFSPGPLTFVLPKKDIIPDIVTGGGDTVALRVPGHPLTLKLLSQLDFPLAAPSANPFGYISPVNAFHVKEQLDGKVPYILDGGNCMVGVESTVIRVIKGKIEILRHGGVPKEELEKFGEIISATPDSELQTPSSPGMLKSHYAPKIELHLGRLEELVKAHAGKRIAILSFRRSFAGGNVVAEEILSPNGDLHEAARNLFSAMRKLDASGADVILAEFFPEVGLGAAINDRLKRASAR